MDCQGKVQGWTKKAHEFISKKDLDLIMELKDLFITPFYLVLLTIVAYFIRPIFTTSLTRKYFIPALWAKFIGAISLALIYQFYYGGGDTFMYFNLGSKHVWQAFLDHPLNAIRLIFAPMEVEPSLWQYQSRIYTYGDAGSYFVVRAAGFFDIFTLHTYSATSLFFAFVSFLGVWHLFLGFVNQYPHLVKQLAVAILFIPSTIFWGSGLLKDSITIGALGFLFYSSVELFRFKRRPVQNVIIMVLSFYTIYIIKIYIVLSFIPAALIWIYVINMKRISNGIARLILGPLLFSGIAAIAFYSINISSSSSRYSLERVLVTAEETARWNHYVSVQQGGSGYTLGGYDFSPGGLAGNFIPGILTTVFRPMIFEARNPVMLLSAIENTAILFLTLAVIKGFFRRSNYSNYSILILCFVFVIFFSFAVGVSTYNFGALARYRIPMLPFLFSGLVILRYSQKQKLKAT